MPEDRPLRLLIVEDNEDDTLLLMRTLKQEGFNVEHRRVETAEAMAAALAEEEWSAVISDYNMPHFNAPAALSLFRSQGTDVPFIVVSGTVGEEVAVAIMKAGAHDFVAKANLARVGPALMRELSEAEERRRRRRAEEEKHQLQEQLLQAQKMEAIGVLTAGVAHDFNNILGAIQIYAELARMKAAAGAPAEYELGQVVAATDRAAGLARQLLLFSRKQPLELVPLDLNRTVSELMKMLRRIIGEDIEIRTELTRELWQVVGDAGGLEQILMNLAVNARDAMPNGGMMTISTRNETVGEEDCRATLEARPGPHVCLSVQDTGSGMNAETARRLFEPFFTTKGAGKGTGLGLSVVYGIVKQHQGWIDFRTAPGTGTRFEIHLPAQVGNAVVPSEERAGAETLRGAGERILAVEDEEGFLAVTTEALRSSGYTVTAVTGAREALENLRREPSRFDLLFADVVLEDGNGLDLAMECLALRPGLKVLLSSGYTDDRSRLPEIQARQIPFLPKPYSFTSLLMALRGLLRPGDKGTSQNPPAA